MKKFKNFLKAKKGAELLEIILGVVIAIAVMAVAIIYITKTIQGQTGDDTLKVETSYEVETVVEDAGADLTVGDYVIVVE